LHPSSGSSNISKNKICDADSDHTDSWSYWIQDQSEVHPWLSHCPFSMLKQYVYINRFNGLETFFLSLIYKNPRSRFMLELMMIFVSI
jgi:hypothetical protein